MNKRCSVCNHPSRAEIDRSLLAGVPRRDLAARHGLSTAALSRHAHHLRQEVALQEHRAYQAQQQATPATSPTRDPRARRGRSP